MKTPTLLAIVLVALIISVPTGAKAFTLIDLSDSIEVRDSHGTVVGSGTVNESSPPIIETDKQGNIVAVFQRITFDVPLPTPGTGFQHRIFLTEPDGTISDEILIGTATQQSVLNVTLLSEVDGKPFPFRLDPTVPHIRETGDLQDLTAFLDPASLGAPGFHIFARSDVEAVPEPATVLLLVAGAAGLGGAAWWRRHRRTSPGGAMSPL